MSFFLIASSLALGSQSLPAPTTGDPITVTGKADEGKKKKCREVETLGSIIPQRVCKTKDQWAAEGRVNERRTRDYISDKNNMSARAPARKESGQ